MQAFITILLFSCILPGELLQIGSHANSNEFLIEALIHVIESDSTFACRTLGITLEWSSVDGKHAVNDIAAKVLPTVKKHALTMSTPSSSQVIDRGFHFVWIFDTSMAFDKLQFDLRQHYSQSPNYANGFFLLVYVFPTHMDNNKFEIQQMLGAFNHLKIFGAILMVATPTLDSVNFYASPAVQAEACFYLKPKIINTYQDGQLQTSQMFEGILENFHGCPLRASVFKAQPYISVNTKNRSLTGFEGEMITTIAKTLNASLDVVAEGEQDEMGNTSGENLTGIFQQLKNSETDFVAGLQVFSASKLKEFTPSISYMTTDQILVLRRSRKINFNSEWIFSPFPTTTWIGIIVTCCSLLLVSTLVQLKSHTISASSQPFILQMFAVMLGLPSSIPPLKFHMYRIAFFITCFGVLVLRSIYQGKVFSTYRSIPLEDTPQTFDELMYRNYTVYAMDAFDMPEVLLKHSEQQRRDGFRLISSNLSQSENFAHLEQSSGNIAIAATFTYYRYHLAKYNKHMVFKMFPKNVLQLKGCVYFRRNSYLAPSFNAIINRLLKSGILMKWFSFYAQPDFVQEGVNAIAINWEKINLVFVWHAYLCGLATVVFVMEILRGRYKKWRKQRRCIKNQSKKRVKICERSSKYY